MMSRTESSCFPILLLTLASFASAQTYRGSIRGNVTDPNGAAIAGASISVVSKDYRRRARGRYKHSRRVHDLFSSTRTLHTQSYGRDASRAFRCDIALNVNQELRVDATLAPRCPTLPPSTFMPAT